MYLVSRKGCRKPPRMSALGQNRKGLQRPYIFRLPPKADLRSRPSSLRSAQYPGAPGQAIYIRRLRSGSVPEVAMQEVIRTPHRQRQPLFAPDGDHVFGEVIGVLGRDLDRGVLAVVHSRAQLPCTDDKFVVIDGFSA